MINYHRLTGLRLPLLMRFLLGITLILGFSLLVFNLLMEPPAREIGLMASYLAITAMISALVGYGSYRLGWMERSPSILWTLMGSYAISSLLTFINVGFAAYQMFANQHDLLLATVLLLFAGGMAMAFGYFISSALTDRISQLGSAARTIARGDLSPRVRVSGKDEMAELGHTFNQMVVQLEAAAKQQQALETLRRDLIAWVSHDLQTPLASLRAIIEALGDGIVEDPDTVQRYLQTAQREVRSMSLLIDDLFQMALLDAGGLQLELGENNLSDLISDTLESFSRPAQQQGVQLRGSMQPGIDPVMMDAARIGRVLNNLISNALQHTPSGGAVEVRAGRLGDFVQVEVCDTGEGVQPEEIPFLFERFYRGEKSRSRSTGRTGLGLAIARGIVETHGGKIQVRSQPGETCFYFTLPLVYNRQDDQ